MCVFAGESEYVNDIPAQVDEVYGAFVLAKKGPGKLLGIDTSKINVIIKLYEFW